MPEPPADQTVTFLRRVGESIEDPEVRRLWFEEASETILAERVRELRVSQDIWTELERAVPIAYGDGMSVAYVAFGGVPLCPGVRIVPDRFLPRLTMIPLDMQGHPIPRLRAAKR